MALSFGSLVEFGLSFHADDLSTFGKRQMQELVNDAIGRLWGFTRWPFAIGNGTFATIAGPYTTGTLTTDGDTTIAGSSTDWQTSWPLPALLTIDGDPNVYFVTEFTSTTALVVDKAVQRSNASGLTYQLQFPAYELPSDFEAIETPQQYNWWSDLSPISYDEWMALTSRAYWSGNVSSYAVIPGDGVNAGKIFLHPAPSVAEIVRFPYRKMVPRGRMWEEGTITLVAVTTGDATVEGSGTAWTSTGMTLPGMILEVPNVTAVRHIQGVVSSVTDADTLELTANWQGAAQSAVNYRLSTRLALPDLVLPALHDTIKAAVCEARRDYVGMGMWERKWRDEARRAAGRVWPLAGNLQKADADPGDGSCVVQPAWPKLVVVES